MTLAIRAPRALQRLRLARPVNEPRFRAAVAHDCEARRAARLAFTRRHRSTGRAKQRYRRRGPDSKPKEEQHGSSKSRLSGRRIRSSPLCQRRRRHRRGRHARRAAAADAASRRSRSRARSRRPSAATRWPGVGQYEKIVGMAYGELDPHDPKNAVIVDIQLAPRNASGNVEYSHDFYILKPHRPDQGRAQADVRAAQSRRQDVSARSIAAPAATTRARSPTRDARELVPDAARLLDRVERLGLRRRARTTANFNVDASTCRSPRTPDGSTITGPAYEYIVSPRRPSYTLTYPAATLDKSKATLTHRVHLERHAAGGAGDGLGLQRRRHGDLASPAATFVANDIYEFSTRPRTRRSTASASPRCATSTRSCATRRRTTSGNANPLAGDVTRIYTEVVVAAGPHAERLPQARLQPGRERQEGVRRP